MSIRLYAAYALLLIPMAATAAAAPQLGVAAPGDPSAFVLADRSRLTPIAIDQNDFEVVKLAAGLLADDVQRVTGRRPAITEKPGAATAIVAGTLGHSALIDQLASSGKLPNLNQVRGQWETTLWQIVDRPFPGVSKALVIAGSDRRAVAYGLLRISETIGVSPWYWWADAPVAHRDAVAVRLTSALVDRPGVKYRGIFINDEDWGMGPWAAKTFDPQFGNIGPKTYEKIFELMLRLRLNYFWPAMHEVSIEFGSVPENAALADRYAIVAGSSHCEPMLYNNVHWDEKKSGRWNYSLNRDAIHSYWENITKTRGGNEAVWTLGIRGIHDRGMQSPPNDLAGKIDLVSKVMQEQRELLDRNVSQKWGPVAQSFVPYKEVLPIYDGGLKVPDDVTLVWVDDNFGYIRRLSTPQERSRRGGAGVYWHISYYGGPHSYTWINTTAPALMWEELRKAWDNDARTIWVLNVGDLKPMEIGVDYFSRFSWAPDAFPLGAQPAFLRDFAARNFGVAAQPVANLLMDFYRLGTVRKPELMNRQWALGLQPETAAQLEGDYRRLLDREKEIAAMIPAAARDSYTETVGFPARALAATGLIFMADRKAQRGTDAEANGAEITRLRDFLNAEVDNYNNRIAGGKWKYMMPGTVTNQNLTSWSSQVRWPWGEQSARTQRPAANAAPAIQPATAKTWRDAASADRRTAKGQAQWVAVPGLGSTGKAMMLTPQNAVGEWKEDDRNAPALEYVFQGAGGDAEAFIDFLPTFRIYPGSKLRVAVNVDGKEPALLEVPGSSGAENENGPVRSSAVQDNYTRLRVPLAGLSAGRHVLRIRAVDPGVVIDRVSLP
jgi:hypothetical protein